MRSSLKTLPLAAAACLLFTTAAQAAFWRCELPGGIYVVSLPTIASVSTHEYYIENTGARVTELTVGTNSAVVARFYYMEPPTPKSPIGLGQSLIDKAQEHVSDAANRAGVEEIWKKVGKNYPLTTHAHTVEYRLESVDQIKKLETSLETAWRNNQDVTVKVSDSEDSGS